MVIKYKDRQRLPELHSWSSGGYNIFVSWGLIFRILNKSKLIPNTFFLYLTSVCLTFNISSPLSILYNLYIISYHSQAFIYDIYIITILYVISMSNISHAFNLLYTSLILKRFLWLLNMPAVKVLPWVKHLFYILITSMESSCPSLVSVCEAMTCHSGAVTYHTHWHDHYGMWWAGMVMCVYGMFTLQQCKHRSVGSIGKVSMCFIINVSTFTSVTFFKNPKHS